MSNPPNLTHLPLRCRLPCGCVVTWARYDKRGYWLYDWGHDHLEFGFPREPHICVNTARYARLLGMVQAGYGMAIMIGGWKPPRGGRKQKHLRSQRKQ